MFDKVRSVRSRHNYSRFPENYHFVDPIFSLTIRQADIRRVASSGTRQPPHSYGSVKVSK